MATTRQLPPGSKILVYQDPVTGRVQQTGAAQLPDGNMCRCSYPNWQPCAPSQLGGGFAMVSPAQAASIQAQMAGGASARGNSFGNVYLPGGSFGLKESRGNKSPVGAMGLLYTVIFDNTAGGGTPAIARQFLGDYTGTYALLGNTEVSPTGFVIGGTWGTASKSQLIARTIARPWSVDRIQFIAGVSTYFNNANNYYFDTKPNRNNATVDGLQLTGLTSADQYNPTIQWFNDELTLDGVNGLDISVPIGGIVTINLYLSAERSSGEQVKF